MHWYGARVVHMEDTLVTCSLGSKKICNAELMAANANADIEIDNKEVLVS